MVSSHDGHVELSLEVSGLRVSISGPSSVAADLVCYLSDFRPTRAASPSSSLGSFTRVSVVSSPEHPARSAPVRETRDQIAASFVPCPLYIKALGNRLQGSERSVDVRIERAWTAGQWAGAVLQERVHPPNRTPPLDLRSRFYAVAKCEGLESPTIYKSSGSYWRRIGSLEGSHSISQSFPSEAESIIYLRAAGFREEEIQVLPYFLQRWRCQWI